MLFCRVKQRDSVVCYRYSYNATVWFNVRYVTGAKSDTEIKFNICRQQCETVLVRGMLLMILALGRVLIQV